MVGPPSLALSIIRNIDCRLLEITDTFLTQTLLYRNNQSFFPFVS